MIRKSKLDELNSYIEELKTIKTTVLIGESAFLKIHAQEYLLNNGKTIRREEIIKNGNIGNAAIILPITKEGNILLIVEPRVLTKETVAVALPAGYIDVGEDPIKAALRELEEETGYVTGDIRKMGCHYQDQGCSRALNHSFIAFDCEKRHDQKLDKDEYIKYFECTYDEAIELMDIGYINDANSVITLLKSKKYMGR